MATKQAVS